jgi:hypothetical protein
MSTTRKLTLDFAISAESYIYDLYFSEEFSKALYLEGLGFSRCEQISFDRTAANHIQRTLRLCPAMNAPKPVQKVLGDTQQYDEIGSFTPATNTWSYNVIPSTMASKIQTVGQMAVEASGPNRCTIHFEVTFDVKLFGVGKVIERFMASQFDDNLSKQKRFTEDWIAQRS